VSCHDANAILLGVGREAVMGSAAVRVVLQDAPSDYLLPYRSGWGHVGDEAVHMCCWQSWWEVILAGTCQTLGPTWSGSLISNHAFRRQHQMLSNQFGTVPQSWQLFTKGCGCSLELWWYF